MLNDRVELIIKYLQLVNEGKIEKDYEMLRKISSLCHRLPTVDSDQFRKDYTKEMNEVLLITYMATITKGTNVLNDVIEKYNVCYERRRGGGGRSGGLPF
jgi:COP9 signalosome complex subunit 6